MVFLFIVLCLTIFSGMEKQAVGSKLIMCCQAASQQLKIIIKALVDRNQMETMIDAAETVCSKSSKLTACCHCDVVDVQGVCQLGRTAKGKDHDHRRIDLRSMLVSVSIHAE